jgi:BirA family transcriptional regulator, biotin operon repressor / biotin---[acetyl-CoA-carboxylase] ligase
MKMFGSVLIKLDVIDSTNSYATELLKKSEVEEGAVIVANFQTAGKGQTDNSWYSKKGENILISLIIYPEFLNLNDIFLLNQFTSLAIIDFLKKFDNHISFKIKWPNDIIADNGKIAGILISNIIGIDRINSSIIGIGLNINASYFPANIPGAVSLKILSGREFDLQQCLTLLLSNLENRYHQLLKGDYNTIRTEYASLLYLLNLNSEFRDSTGFSFSGKIAGVGNDGRLCILVKGYEKYFSFKEIILKKNCNE